jgi:hypothetical protein
MAVLRIVFAKLATDASELSDQDWSLLKPHLRLGKRAMA